MPSDFSSHRLPISHPDYRYPPSVNPYWKKIQEFKGTIFTDNETESDQGRWRSQFKQLHSPKERKLWVEIGCNAGHVAVELASRHPEAILIGMDWKFKPIFRAAEKTRKRKLDNLLFFRAHAERIRYIFGPGEVDQINLFFPDPWPKKAQMKNRFFNSKHLSEIHEILRPGGVFHIKTDHRGYFEAMLEVVNQANQSNRAWEILELTRDLHQDHPAPETLDFPDVTLFEKLFIKDGIPIQSLKLRSQLASHLA
jgi:tRNA (guanine-N7-)-methyltransferase